MRHYLQGYADGYWTSSLFFLNKNCTLNKYKKIGKLASPLDIITKTCPCNMQRLFSAVKIENIIGNLFYIFNIIAQNIDCGYTLEPPRLATI